MSISDQKLIDRYFQGRASDDEIAELESRLLADPELRKQYLHDAMAENDLRSFALREEGASPYETTEAPTSSRLLRPFALLAAAAAIVIAVLVVSTGTHQAVGTIVSSEQAGWESEHPTLEGAALRPGVYALQAGLATLVFDSGAEMTIKAPTKFEVVSGMQVMFDYGEASFYAPESAKGFQVDTRFGQVVDHGTKFSLELQQGADEARFSVQEGEIALHHNKGDVQHLLANEAAQMTTSALEASVDPLAEGTLQARTPAIALPPVREATIIYSHTHPNAPSRVPPDFLLVKHQAGKPNANRRALIAFDVSALDLKQISAARFHLNAVPSGLGLVTDMPKVSEFVLLAIPDGALESWKAQDLRWKDAPQLEDLTPVANFSLARSEQRKAITLESSELLQHLRSDRSGEVSFMLHCLTKGTTLVHGFASSQHREAAGPVLEVE
jgi:hypothetical protein